MTRWLGFACLAVAVAAGGAVADGKALEILDLAESLVDSEGREWVDCRSAALELSEQEWEGLMAWLDRSGATRRERFAKGILEAHRAYPEIGIAIELDQLRAMSNPVPVRSMDTVYRIGLNNAEEAREFYYEIVWKRSDWDKQLRGQSAGFIEWWEIELDWVWVLLEDAPEFARKYTLPVKRYLEWSVDPEGYRFMEASFAVQRSGEGGGFGNGSAVARFVRSVGTERAEACRAKLLQWEQELAVREGRSPWSDDEAQAKYMQSMQAVQEAERSLRSAQRSGGVQELIDRLEQEVERAMEEREAAELRFRDRLVWEALMETAEDRIRKMQEARQKLYGDE